MNKLLLLLFFHCFFEASLANHLVGGELYYAYKGVSLANKPLYTVTLRFFRNMTASVPSIQNEPVYIGIYQNNSLISTVTLPFQKVDTIKSTSLPTCVNSSLQTIYEVGYFSADVEMPSSSPNYTLAWIRCCRTNLVDNMNLNNGGITLTTIIPGTGLVGSRPNNSAIFSLKDTVLLCNNQYFNLDFSASDVDNDSLSYQFYPALDGASLFDPSPSPNNSVVITPLTYKTPQFSATAPLGVNVQLNQTTGQISGTAPAAGTYLVTARVFEWRNGMLINEHSKDILIKVKNCSYSQAQLKPVYLLCDSSTVSFSNEIQGTPTDNWFWDFGVPSLASDTSHLANPQYTYPQPGTYGVTLIVNKDKPCPATATARVDVYPGLKAGFTLLDSCVDTQIGFTDTSHYDLGVINQWNWDFGEPQAAGNTSQQQNPVYTYASPGLKTVRLIIGSDKGCTDTSYRNVQVLPLPSLSLAQHSLTICRGDSVQLLATGTGSFSWAPSGSLSDPQSANPFAAPSLTTTYSVTLTDAGCSAKDSVILTLLPQDAIHIQPVSPLCIGDTVRLKAISAAAVVQWNASAYLSDPNSFTPLTAPSQDTWYYIKANPGLCQTEDSIRVMVLISPQLNAGSNLQIQEGQTEQLNASGADLYYWSPASGLSNANIPNPYVNLPIGVDSITYVLTGKLYNGCTRTDSLTIHVAVVPFADAPTAFTPNGDGRNDVFKPIVKGLYQLVDFTVFNRWGQIVFQTEEPGRGWNGTIDQVPSETGVYVWMLRARNKTTGEVFCKKGTVALIK